MDNHKPTFTDFLLALYALTDVEFQALPESEQAEILYAYSLS